MLSCIVVARAQMHIERLQVKSCSDGLQINRISRTQFLFFQVNKYLVSLGLHFRSEACKCIDMKACKVNYCIQGFQLNACQCILKARKVIITCRLAKIFQHVLHTPVLEFLNILCELGSE